MSTKGFSVTYNIITQESAELGDYDEMGVISEGGNLHDAAKDLFATRTHRVDSGDGLQDCDGWIEMNNGMEYETGAYETRMLHAPRNITPSSYKRLVRALRNYY